MGFIQRIKETAGRIVGMEKAGFGVLVGRGGGIIPGDDKYAYAKAYTDVVWVYACAYVIATSLAKLPWKLKRGEKEVEPSHYLYQLLNDPNEEQTWFDLLEGTVLFMELTGDAYWEVVDSNIRPAENLHLLRPDRVTIKSTDDGKNVQEYLYQYSEKKDPTRYSPEEIIHFLWFSPVDDWYGQGSTKPVTDAVLIERSANKYNKAFFDNDATPVGILTTDQPVSEDEARKIEQLWQARNAGAGNAHKTPLLPKGLKYQALGIRPRDMEFKEQKKMDREEILAAFGVPPIKVGLVAESKYAAYQMQERAFYKDTIQPKAIKIQGLINKKLIRKFDDEIYFEFDLEPFISEPLTEQANRLVGLFERGAVSPNEIRRDLRLGEPYEGGDRFYVQSKMEPVMEEEPVSQEELDSMTQELDNEESGEEEEEEESGEGEEDKGGSSEETPASGK